MGVEVALIASAIALSTAVSVGTSIFAARQQAQQARQQGKAQEAMAKYNAAIANNQAIAEQQSAEAAQLAAKESGKRQYQESKRLKAHQVAAMAKSGVTITGTPILVQEDQLAEMKLQELDILHSGSLRSRQHQLAATGAESAAAGSLFEGQLAGSLAKKRARSSMLTGGMEAAGAGVIGAAQLAALGASTYRAPTTTAGPYGGGVGGGPGIGFGVS